MGVRKRGKPFEHNRFIERLNSTYKYRHEADFVKKLRALKTYCPGAYKDLIFNLDKNSLHFQENGNYIHYLYTSPEFAFVYGEIKLIYTVEDGNVIIEDLAPQKLLLDGYHVMLDTYKGVIYRNEYDKFKIDLYMERKKIKNA